MELKHTINGIEILEPIGFDGLKTTIKRHDYHGMSAEVSVGTLEFSGKAASIIHDAYNTDIDTELNYVVTDEWGGVIYSGMIDISTYDEHSGDYFTVSCKVGEVGVKTIFNNRTSTDVDLNTRATIDDSELAHIPQWKKLTIPAKTIKMINHIAQNKTQTYEDEMLLFEDETQWGWLNLALDTSKTNEYGDMMPMLDFVKFSGYDVPIKDYVNPLFVAPEGTVQSYNIDYRIKIKIKPLSPIVTTQRNNGADSSKLIQASLKLTDGYIATGNGIDYSGIQYWGKDDSSEKEFEISGSASSLTYPTLALGVYFWNNNSGYNDPVQLSVTIEKDSYVKMSVNTQNATTVRADMLMVHEAINTIVEAISDNALTVKSSLYNRCDSIVHALPVVSIQAGATQFGPGSLKAITNGYKIRGLYTDMERSRNMPISFKNMIEALDAIDCVGWGFSQEDGQLYIRVEKWDWFYKGTKLFALNDIKEKQRKINNDLVITQLDIGYKKYMTSEEYNAIDSIHGERTFATTTTAVAKSVSKLCNFIADNYAIEETRRAAIEKSSADEYKFDENIFIFALSASQYYNGGITYFIPKDIDPAENYSGIDRAETYNAKISPARNAFRWINRLFCLNGLKPFDLTKGTVNYRAEFKTLKDAYRTGYARDYYLKDDINKIPMLGIQVEGGEFEDSWQQSQWAESLSLQERYYTTHKCIESDGTEICEDVPSENDYIIPRVFKAEELIIKYPLTFSQYKAIMANPYGIITVDGEECWLKEMTYSFFKDEAELKLIPKAN